MVVDEWEEEMVVESSTMVSSSSAAAGPPLYAQPPQDAEDSAVAALPPHQDAGDDKDAIMGDEGAHLRRTHETYDSASKKPRSKSGQQPAQQPMSSLMKAMAKERDKVLQGQNEQVDFMPEQKQQATIIAGTDAGELLEHWYRSNQEQERAIGSPPSFDDDNLSEQMAP